VTLSPPLSVALSKRGERELDEWEIKRIQVQYTDGIANPTSGLAIDNSKKTPEETARLVVEKIKSATA